MGRNPDSSFLSFNLSLYLFVGRLSSSPRRLTSLFTLLSRRAPCLALRPTERGKEAHLSLSLCLSPSVSLSTSLSCCCGSCSPSLFPLSTSPRPRCLRTALRLRLRLTLRAVSAAVRFSLLLLDHNDVYFEDTSVQLYHSESDPRCAAWQKEGGKRRKAREVKGRERNKKNERGENKKGHKTVASQ